MLIQFTPIEPYGGFKCLFKTSLCLRISKQMDILTEITQSGKTFVIAEIGQNHQGNLDTAKLLIKTAKEAGADCVKFQKTCLNEKFTKSALDAPYCSVNAWGSTYREHKMFLEFSDEQFLDLQAYSKEMKIHFTASAMDEQSFDFLTSLNVPFIKIGSGDANNLFLLEKAAKSGVPLVISTGMCSLTGVERIYKLMSKHQSKFALLHCTSAYPTPFNQINLKVIPELQSKFPDTLIGYSGHEKGTHITVAAVALGAKIVERHVTMNKNQKGSDHCCSLEPHQLKAMIEHIRAVELALGAPIKRVQRCEEACFQKLGKSLVYGQDLGKGHRLRPQDFKVKVSLVKGLSPFECSRVDGKSLVCSVNIDEPVQLSHVSF